MRTKTFILLLLLLVGAYSSVEACTGISLRTKDGKMVLSRTIEWGGSEMASHYIIVPKGHQMVSMLPNGGKGLAFQSKFGFVGLTVENTAFVMEGLNEAGLSAGLFYFPGYGEYPEFLEEKSAESIADLQLVSWILARFATVEELIQQFSTIRVCGLDPRSSTVHWRIADASGREVVLEIVNGKAEFHENKLGVLANSPGFQWHMTNLNTYVNLSGGIAEPKQYGEELKLSSFGVGSAAIGIPGDFTPPSRFIRAAFFKLNTPAPNDTQEAVLQCFHMLNNFDIPIGVEFKDKDKQYMPQIPSATQWTTATDIHERCLYYRTMHNSAIRRIDLKRIDFSKTSYTEYPLDEVKEERIIDVKL